MFLNGILIQHILYSPMWHAQLVLGLSFTKMQPNVEMHSTKHVDDC